jgi:hypothetical protein
LKEEQEEMGGIKLEQRRQHFNAAAGRRKWTDQMGGKREEEVDSVLD